MERIKALLETEESKVIIEAYEPLIEAASEMVDDFKVVLKEFVMENPYEFIGENLDDTIKNIRVFSEVATAQYMTEVSALCNTIVEEINEELVEEANENPVNEALSDYL